MIQGFSTAWYTSHHVSNSNRTMSGKRARAQSAMCCGLMVVGEGVSFQGEIRISKASHLTVILIYPETAVVGR